MPQCCPRLNSNFRGHWEMLNNGEAKMTKQWTLALLMIFASVTICLAETASFIVDQNTTVDCLGTGYVTTSPPPKSHKITMTQFKKNTVYYTGELSKGNEVIIVNYNGANYQVIKL
jgi:hypothetical protein